MSAKLPIFRHGAYRQAREFIRGSIRARARTFATEVALPAQGTETSEGISLATTQPETPKSKKPRRPIKPEHGSRIYVYRHLLKNHVVYSLDKTMNNNAALRQLPYNGKKTVPPALRKDHWTPLCTIHLPPLYTRYGLIAFQRLREFRRRHEMEWGDEIRYKQDTYFTLKAEGKKPEREDVKKRGRKICDQYANSIADIAAVLGGLKELRQKEIEADQKGLRLGVKGKPKPRIPTLENEGTEDEEIRVFWSNLQDAGFAEKWEGMIRHGELNQLDARGGMLFDQEMTVLGEVEGEVEGQVGEAQVIEDVEKSEKKKPGWKLW